MKYLLLPLLLGSLLCTCDRAPSVDYGAEKTGRFASAAVVGPHPLATRVAREVLADGGNAVDAAVAMQFAMAVVYPRAGNLGGGGFLVYRDRTGKVDALDFRERAPAAAHRDLYLDSLGNVIPGLSTRGHRAVGVPGTVAGSAAMHERYGSLPWERLVQPAIELATDGYRLSAAEAERLRNYRADFAEFNAATPFSDTTQIEGTLVRQPDLAATLTRIATGGKAAFYGGETADLIVAEMESGGGLITHEDLREYAVSWRTPITSSYDNYRLISMPPSSSGGVALAQMATMLQPLPLDAYGFHTTASVHASVEAMRRAYSDRATYLGDSDFYPVPLDSLLDSNYLAGRMGDFRPDSAGRSATLPTGFGSTKETFETTHISIIDAAGNAVSLTTTLNGNFGSKVMVDGAGFFLNNEMDDFSAKPGVPNMFGLVGGEANAIQPGKRMLSSMTPTIIERDGELFMVLGAPGGSTIITAVLQTFLNVVEYELPLAEAVAAPRFHHQYLPDEILYEPAALSPEVRDSLESMGHRLREVRAMAVIKALLVRPDGTIEAAGDARNADDDVEGI